MYVQVNGLVEGAGVYPRHMLNYLPSRDAETVAPPAVAVVAVAAETPSK